MVTLNLVLMLLAFIFLLLAALRVPSPKVDLMALGLALWVLAALLK